MTIAIARCGERAIRSAARDNGTHGGINGRAAALRMVQRFLFGSQKATDGCALPGSPDVSAPCDCATGACD